MIELVTVVFQNSVAALLLVASAIWAFKSWLLVFSGAPLYFFVIAKLLIRNQEGLMQRDRARADKVENASRLWHDKKLEEYLKNLSTIEIIHEEDEVIWSDERSSP